MVWILCSGIIILMTTHTFRGCIRIIARGVALGTILNIVALRQGEKIVVDTFRIPSKAKWIMAFDTIHGIARLLMVWALGGHIIVTVTGNTFIPDTIKT